MSRSTPDMLDIRKTPEIYPMTSMQETLEYFHDKLNHLSTRAYETTAAIQRLGEQVQQLSTRSPKKQASIEPVQQTVCELGAAPLWGRLQAKFKAAPALEPEAVQEPAKPLRRASDAEVITVCRLKRPSLCIPPPDDMEDIMQAISPQSSSLSTSPETPVTDAPRDRYLASPAEETAQASAVIVATVVDAAEEPERVVL
jgi:hypothetical protein